MASMGIRVLNECKICFYLFESPGKEYRCDFCREKMLGYYPQSEQLERTLSIMEKTNSSRLPEILRKMYELLAEKDL
jgi:hypothetical protein